MTVVDLAGSAVIVTGGTRGLGKAIGLEFGRAGARIFLTHRWGSADETELRGEFEAAGLSAPHVVESDASDPLAAEDLMRLVGDRPDRLIAIISNVAFAKVTDGIDELQRGPLELSLRYSTWPVLHLVHASKHVLGYYPRYVLAISSDGAEVCHPGYDMVGVSKAALETLCLYLALRLRGEGVRVNVVRPGPLDTASTRATFRNAPSALERAREQGLLLDPRSVACACVGLCCGLMDSVTGQVLTVDEGISLLSPVVHLSDAHGPESPSTATNDGPRQSARGDAS